MKPVFAGLALSLLALSVGCPWAVAQTTSSPAETEQLELIVGKQQKALEQQQAQILALQSALAEQKEMLFHLLQRGTGATLVQAAERKSDNDPQAQGEPVPAQTETQSLTPEQKRVDQELQRGPEIADITPTTPALDLGPAKVR